MTGDVLGMVYMCRCMGGSVHVWECRVYVWVWECRVVVGVWVWEYRVYITADGLWLCIVSVVYGSTFLGKAAGDIPFSRTRIPQVVVQLLWRVVHVPLYFLKGRGGGCR